jgi:hypothetical protein
MPPMEGDERGDRCDLGVRQVPDKRAASAGIVLVGEQTGRNSRIRTTIVILVLVAIVFYAGFLFLGISRS